MRLIATTAVAALLACPALAAPNCASNAQVEAILTEKFQEEPVSHGMTENGHLMMWWGNLDTGSWTITETLGENTCIRASGGGFKRLAMKPNV